MALQFKVASKHLEICSTGTWKHIHTLGTDRNDCVAGPGIVNAHEGFAGLQRLLADNNIMLAFGAM